MQDNDKKYVTLTNINEINYCLKISEVFKNRPGITFCLTAIQ